MRVLVAEDDPVSRRVLEVTLARWGYDVEVCADGFEGWQALSAPAAPDLAILDWMMPGMDGVDLCRRARRLARRCPTYIILLTAKGERTDVIEGLQAGADDYITKPFDRDELSARLQVGVRVVALQHNLAARVDELEVALSRVKLLQGLLPICAYCKKIRDDQNYWQQVEQYVTERSDVTFSHSICPQCYQKHVEPELRRLPGHGGRPNPGAAPAPGRAALDDDLEASGGRSHTAPFKIGQEVGDS